MGAQMRVYRQRIRSVQATKKITNAMELIAASRVVKARQRVAASTPYARALTRAVSAVATYSNVDHPLTVEHPEVRRAAMVDHHQRPRPGRRLLLERAQGEREARREAARRGQGGRPLPRRSQGRGLLQVPPARVGRHVGRLLRQPVLRGGPRDRRRGSSGDFITAYDEGGVDEIHVVYTRFVSMVTQEPEVIRLLPLEVVEGEEAPAPDEVLPLYEFEPSAEQVLDALLPQVRHVADLQRAAAGRGLASSPPASAR